MIERRRRIGILKLIIGLANHLKPEEYKNKEVGGGRGRKIEVVPKSEIINILLHQHLLLIQEEKIHYLCVSCGRITTIANVGRGIHLSHVKVTNQEIKTLLLEEEDRIAAKYQKVTLVL